MSKTVKTVITYLEMMAEPFLHHPPPANLKLMLMRAEHPSVAFYRFLYDAVGSKYTWVDRKRMSDTELADILGSEVVEVWVLYVSGCPAGYFEVDARDKETVELKYFGLIPDYHGMGLGKWFMAEAVRACWARKPNRVIVDTCTLDGPAALPLYQLMGFVPYDRQEREIEIN
jgi:GNAT superfamily N-acetyltransferase